MYFGNTMGLNKLISLSKSDMLATTDESGGGGRRRDTTAEAEDNYLEQQNQLNVLKCSAKIQQQQQQQLFGSDFDICKKSGDYGVKKQTLWSSLKIPKKIKGTD